MDLSALEPYTPYQPWPSDAKRTNTLKPDDGKCLHYHFYFLEEESGLWYLRVPTWCPFRLQFYGNGHNWLAPTLDVRALDARALDMRAARHLLRF